MQLEHSLHFMKGDIFNSTAELMINPVNTVGVMGAGLAEKFKKKFRFCAMCPMQMEE